MLSAADRRNREASTLPSCGCVTVRPQAAFCNRIIWLGTVLVVAAFCFSSQAEAQPRFRFVPQPRLDRFELSKEIQIESESIGEVRPHLARAEALAENGNWDEAIKALRRILADFSGRTIQISPRRYVSVRTLCHMHIAAMPKAALELYRDRVDAAAEKLYQEGVAQRDAATLRQIVDTLFCSSYGDDALNVLAQLALEQGNYDEARRYWELISPLLRTRYGQSAWIGLYGYNLDEEWDELGPQFQSRSDAPHWLAYPDSDLSLASIRARLTLVSILEGASERAEMELEIFRRLHSEAKGRLAGQKGPYQATLAKLLRASGSWQEPASDDRDIPTGSLLPSAKPAWSVPLRHAASSGQFYVRQGNRLDFPVQDRQLAFYPQVAGDLVFVGNSNALFAFRTASGLPAWPTGNDQNPLGFFFNLVSRSDRPGSDVTSRNRAIDAPRYSMTSHDGLLFARLGPRAIPTESTGASAKDRSHIVCLDITREGSERWRIPREDQFSRFRAQGWVFEGPPAADDTSVYVGMRRGMPWSEAYLACFDIQNGKMRWRTRICAADSIYEAAQNLVTVNEGVIYYNTNLGAVAAVNASDGAVRWIYRYERAGGGKRSQPPPHFFRGLNPCIYHEGLVIAGPADCESIVAIDAVTGDRVWQTVPLVSSHLLGIGHGSLIATGRNVWWFNVRTGKMEAEWTGDDNKIPPRGYGRGVLAGDAIFWPTQDKIFAFDQRLGDRRQPVMRPGIELSQSDAEWQMSGGNLSASRDGLIMATKNRMIAFPWSKTDAVEGQAE